MIIHIHSAKEKVLLERICIQTWLSHYLGFTHHLYPSPTLTFLNGSVIAIQTSDYSFPTHRTRSSRRSIVTRSLSLEGLCVFQACVSGTIRMMKKASNRRRLKLDPELFVNVMSLHSEYF